MCLHYRFGATDAWLMFLLWMSAEGHIGAALVALVMLTLYCFLPFTSKRSS